MGTQQNSKMRTSYIIFNRYKSKQITTEFDCIHLSHLVTASCVIETLYKKENTHKARSTVGQELC